MGKFLSGAIAGDTVQTNGRQDTRHNCPVQRTPSRLDRFWLRRLWRPYGRASRVALGLAAESFRGMCGCGFGALHFAVNQGLGWMGLPLADS